jgi:hypothetical protein
MNPRQIVMLIVLGYAMSIAIPAHAAPIAWGTAQNISGDTDVLTIGTLVGAYNIGDTGVPATTINGVPFAPFEIPDGNSSAAHDAHSITTFLGTLPLYTQPSLASASPPFSTLIDANYQTMLGTGVAATDPVVLFPIGVFPPLLQLTLEGLTPGIDYTIQLWSNDSVLEYGGENMLVDGVSIDSNTTSTTGGTGQYLIGTFTADATSQSISFLGSDGPPLLNGFQIRAVPEPTGFALGTLAAFCLIGATRRNRQRADRGQPTT